MKDNVLFLSNKMQSVNDSTTLPQMWRSIEQWANGLPDPPSGGGYASLTGPGKTTTPGDLTQAGGMTINSPSSSSMGFQVNSNSGVFIQSTLGGGPSGGSLNLAFSAGVGAELQTTAGALRITQAGTGQFNIANTNPSGLGIYMYAQTGPILIRSSSFSGTQPINLGNHISTVNLYTNTSNPNGVITAAAKGDICFESTTPAMWMATAAGTSWTQVGAGGIPDPFNIIVTGVNLAVPATGYADSNYIAVNAGPSPAIDIYADEQIYIHSSENNVDIHADNGSITMRADTTGIGHISLDASNIDIAPTSGSKIGFYNPVGGPVTRQTITGSRAGNVALANLLTALNLLGIIANSTTA